MINNKLLSKKLINSFAFTLIELVISLLISSIILLFLMNFISDTFNEIAYSNKKTKVIIKLYEIEDKLKTLRGKYLSGGILKDNMQGVGSDVILLRTIPGETGTGGYIFAQVDKDTMKIDKNNNVDIIGEKILGYRKISESELNDIESNPNNVYNFNFNLDELFPNILLKDFQTNIYNSGSIFEISLYTNLNFKPQLKNNKYSEIGNNKVEKIIFNF